MFIIEIFLPLTDNEGKPFAPELFAEVRSALAHRFGGVTAFTRSPAVGLWQDNDGVARRDEIVIFEVMANDVDADWWRDYRAQLAHTFRQDEVVIRATQSQRL